MDGELIIQRGIICWWLFCTVSSLSTKAPLLLVLFLVLLAFVRFCFSTPHRRSIPRIRKLLDGLGTGYGFLLYLTTTLVLPRWSPAVKAIGITSAVVALGSVGLYLVPEAHYSYFQTLEKLGDRLQGLNNAANGLRNPVIRFTLCILWWLPCLIFVNPLSMFGIILGLRHDGLLRLELYIRQVRLKLETGLSRIRNRYTGDSSPLGNNGYTHTPLSDGPQTIRLLKLLKRRPFGTIHCNLKEYKLEGAPDYEAISYAWGNAAKTEAIYIDSRAFSVSPRVNEILYLMSSYQDDRFLWIDSICINQKDDKERSNQVSLMKEIYRQASKVVIWLDGVQDPWKARTMLAGLWYNLMFGSAESSHDLIRKYSEQWADAGWTALMNLFSHSWFSRVWVIQEIAMASNVEVLAAGTPLQWDQLSLVSWMLVGNPELNLILQSSGLPGVEEGAVAGIGHACLMSHIRDICMEPKRQAHLSLSLLLDLCSRFESTEARDKIFALLGLLPRGNNMIRADYCKSTALVYTETARYLISLDCTKTLSFAGIGYDRQEPNLPSWVPDWSAIAKDSSYLQNLGRMQHAAKYHAAINSQRDVSFTTTTVGGSFGSSSTMYIKGIRVDTIRHLGPVLNYTAHNKGRGGTQAGNQDTLSRHMQARSIAIEWAKQPYLKTEQHLEEAFWRCLVGDTHFSRPAPIESGEYYRAWELLLCLTTQIPDSADRTADKTRLKALLLLEGKEAEAGDVEKLRREALLWNGARISCCIGRRFCVTERGYMAMVPPGTVQGDAVCLLYGVDVPFILRRHVFNEHHHGEKSPFNYRLVGETYVHGIMDGEMIGFEGLETEVFAVV